MGLTNTHGPYRQQAEGQAPLPTEVCSRAVSLRMNLPGSTGTKGWWAAVQLMRMRSRRVSALELGVFSFCTNLVLRAMHGVWLALLCRLGTQLESRPSCCDLTHLMLRLLYRCCGPMEPRTVFTQAERSFENEKETGTLNSPNQQEVDNLK